MRRRRVLNLLVAGVWLLVSACSSLQTDIDYDPQALDAMSAYTTYSWLPDPGGRDSRINNEFVAEQVMRTTDAVFAERGYRRVDGEADFRMGWHASTEGMTEVTTFNDYYGYGYSRWGYGGGVWVSDTYVDEYTQGTLLIDVVDGDRDELVWRGSVQARFDDPYALPEDIAPKIQESVRRVLTDFPPNR